MTSHVLTVEGKAQVKEMAELLPNIIHQLDANSLTQLSRIAEQLSGGKGAAAPSAEDDDEEIPDLVENFDEAAEEEPKLEEVQA